MLKVGKHSHMTNGNGMGATLDNDRLLDRAHPRANELAAVNDILLAINSSLNLEEVLRIFFDRLTTLFDVQGGSLLLLDPTQQELVFEAVHGGAGASLLRRRMPADRGIAGWVTQHGQSVLVQDVSRDERWFHEIDQTTRFSTHSILAAPIRTHDRTIGAVELVNPRGSKQFTQEDQKLAELFAASAGIAIENARLYRQVEQRLAEVTTLHLISGDLATSLQLDQILHSVVTRLKTVFSCRACLIHLIASDHQDLVLSAASGNEREQPYWSAPFAQGIGRRALQDRIATLVECTDGAPKDPCYNPEMRSLLVIPLFTRESALGTLSFESTHPSAFSAEDRRLMTTIAAQIATAVENVKLYQEVEERAQRLKIAYEDLKELDRLKREFVQNVSHELRTPLSIIKGYIELMRGGNLGVIEPEAQKGLAAVAVATDALSHLLNGILSLQQAEPDACRIGPVNLDQIARAAVSRAATRAQSAGVLLRVESLAHSLEVGGDAELLGLAFDHLLENAIKFSPDGGQVSVILREEVDQLHVLVRDEGIGIPADQLERIFESFYQVDGSTTRRFGGTGLGLSIVRRILQAHQGKVWAESELGKGSTLHFTLPR